MKAALLWIKGNPIAVVAVLLCIASLVSLSVVHVQGSTFVQRLQDRDKEIKKIDTLKRTPVTVPAEELDKPPQRLNIVVNPQTIKDLEEVYGRMTEEYASIFNLAVQFNSNRHLPMHEQLFPDPGTSDYLLIDARTKYRQAFSEMFMPHTDVALYPRMDAGNPLPHDTLKAELDRITREYLSGFFPPVNNAAELKPEEKADLDKRQREGLMEVALRHASKFHIYADANPRSADYPFEIDAWSDPANATLPNLVSVWEGQLNLWVQQDLIAAIANVNQAWNPEANVVINPIKRLLKISVVPGYVGINSSGGLTTNTNFSTGVSVSGNQLLPDDFSKSPTGRRSNSIYDVRHVWVSMIVDYQRLPDVFEALAKTNFMSVLKIELKDVDEYEELKKGFVYGWNDVVEARMLIETLWLRQWTVRSMPFEVRRRLGIPIPGETPADGSANPQ